MRYLSFAVLAVLVACGDPGLPSNELQPQPDASAGAAPASALPTPVAAADTAPVEQITIAHSPSIEALPPGLPTVQLTVAIEPGTAVVHSNGETAFLATVSGGPQPVLW